MGPELYGGRVLVVDDDHVNRMLLTRSLEREGTVAALSLPSRVQTSAERRPVRGDDRRAP
jgi:CheY-like chemotaxis protein